MNLIAIVDSVGRVILGREDVDKSSETAVSLKNPAVVNIQVNQESGQISVQLIPFIFREFVRQDLREAGVSWTFQRAGITTSEDLELEPTIIDQYSRIFEGVEPAEAPSSAPTTEPVELFDEGEIVESETAETTEAPTPETDEKPSSKKKKK